MINTESSATVTPIHTGASFEMAQAQAIAPEAAAAPIVAAAQSGGLGVISGATPGTEIIRGSARISPEGPTNLMVGDRVTVPEGGSANVTFNSPQGGAPLNGVLTGGSDATIGVKTIGPGLEQVQVDMASGDMFVAVPDDLTDAASVAVRKKAAAAAIGDGLGLAALGLAGLAGLAGLSSGSDRETTSGVSPTTPVVPPPAPGTAEPGPGTTPPTPPAPPVVSDTEGLLNPAATTVDNATDALNGGVLAGAGLGDSLAPVDGVVADLTNTLNDALVPLVGEEFTADNPNNLDPVDNTVGSVTGPIGDALVPVVDGLLGDGATESLLEPIGTQVDFVTDAVSGIADTAGLGELVNGLYAGENILTPVTNIVDGVVGGVVGGLLGGTNGLLAPVTGVVDGLLGDGGINLGGVLSPVTGLLGDLTGNLDGIGLGGTIGTDGGILAPVTGLVDGVIGGSDGLLAPVTGLLGDLTGIDAPGAGGLLAPVTDLLGGLSGEQELTVGGDLGDISGGLLAPVEGLLGSLPILDTPDASVLSPVTGLLDSLLGSVTESASSGSIVADTGNLPISADSLLDLLSSADPTGGMLAPVTGILGSATGGDAPLGAGLGLDASGLLAGVNTLADSGSALTDAIPSITSVTETSSPLSSLLNNLTGQ